MISEYFEKILQDTYTPDPEAEAMWDSRAEQFSLSQQSEKTGFPEKVTRLLTEIGYLSGNTVLDIGGGTGRYALPFAKVAKSVTLSDFSAGMLDQARVNAEKAGLSNIRYAKLDWDKIEIAGGEYEKSHDIVFAAMCPAVRSTSGLLKMAAAAKKGCVVNQFIKTHDTLGDRLKTAAGMTDGYDPHNARDTVQATFNILWDHGFNVQIAYHTWQAVIDYSLEKAIARYGGRFAGRSYSHDGRVLPFEEMIAALAADGGLRSENETVLATVYWDVD